MSWLCKKCGQIVHDESIPDECPNFICKNTSLAMWEYIEDKSIDESDENTYKEAVRLSHSDNLDDLCRAEELFRSIPDYRDSAALMKICIQKRRQIEPRKRDDYENTYKEAVRLSHSDNLDDLRRAEELFRSIPGYRDSAALLEICIQKRKRIELRDDPAPDAKSQYRKARALYSAKTKEEILQAKSLFLSLGNYKDSPIMTVKCDRKLERIYEQERKKTYQLAKTHYKSKKSVEHLAEAKRLWESIPNYKDAGMLAQKCGKRIQKLIDPPKHTGVIVAVIVITAIAIIAVIVLFMSGIIGGRSSRRYISSSSLSDNTIETKAPDRVIRTNCRSGDLDGTYYIEAYDEYCDISGNTLTFYTATGDITKSTEWFIDFSGSTLTAMRYDGKATRKVYVYNDGSIDLENDDGYTITFEKTDTGSR